MPREDYDEIKTKFGAFVKAIKEQDTSNLETLLEKDVKCYFSCARAYADGSNHTLFGVRNFIEDLPQTDFFHTRICNYVCRLANQQAQQSAQVVCLLGRHGEKELTYAMVNLMFSNHWQTNDQNWRMSEIRMDILWEEGNFDELKQGWYFEDPHAKTYPGIHLPCINGELDSPWFRISNAEDVLSEEEKIASAFYRYAFAIDNLAFSEFEKAVNEDVVASIEPWGPMDKRLWMQALKYHRQRDRQWGHCGKIGHIEYDGDVAHMVVYRMCGHKQREHPYAYTNENVDIEHACAKYEIDLVKNGIDWRIKRCYYYLGLIELGEYTKEIEVLI